MGIKETIIQLYNEGNHPSEIALMVGRSIAYVINVLEDRGLIN